MALRGSTRRIRSFRNKENFAVFLHEVQILLALLLVGYFALRTKGNERLVLVSAMAAVASALIAQ